MSTETENKTITVTERGHTGQCPVCESSRKWGQEIEWSEKDNAWIHINCPRDEEINDLKHGFCSECFLTITPSGACGCIFD